MIENIKRFNIRVYGLLLNEFKQVLVSDELIQGKQYTKFPGGGLEFGEGTRTCLAREFMEETGIEVKVKDHLFTSDIFIPSNFDNDSQVLCIYYLVESSDWQQIKTSKHKFDFSAGNNENFRWVPLDKIADETHLLLPTDQLLLQHLKSHPIS